MVRSLGLRAEAFSSAGRVPCPSHFRLPGCLVTDIRMAGMSGLDLQDRLAEQGIQLPVIVLTAYPRTRSTVRAIKAGAVTLLEKPYDEEELWDAIRKALAQEAAGRAEAQRRGEIRARATRLTPAERDVMNLIVQGKPNKVIAKQLNMSTGPLKAAGTKSLRRWGSSPSPSLSGWPSKANWRVSALHGGWHALSLPG